MVRFQNIETEHAHHFLACSPPPLLHFYAGSRSFRLPRITLHHMLIGAFRIACGKREINQPLRLFV